MTRKKRRQLEREELEESERPPADELWDTGPKRE